MRTRFLTFALLLVLFACSKSITSSVPVQSDLERAKVKWPEITLAELQQGQELYIANCGKCHSLKSPQSRNEAGWRKIVPPMAKKAKINAQQEELILKYVITMSQAPVK